MDPSNFLIQELHPSYNKKLITVVLTLALCLAKTSQLLEMAKGRKAQIGDLL